MTLTGIVPPGTLTVVRSFHNYTVTTRVPTFDWNSYDQRVVLYPIEGKLQPTPSMLKLASEVAQGMNVLELPHPGPNSTFDMQFKGPSLQCQNANASQQAAFRYFNSAARNQSAIYSVSEYQADPGAFGNRSSFQVYSAFAPGLYEYAMDTNLIKGEPDNYNNWPARLPSNVSRSVLNNNAAQIWLQLSNESIVCTLVEAQFDIGFKYINSVQAITQRNITPLASVYYHDTFSHSNRENHYLGAAMAIMNMLYGNVTLSPSAKGFLLGGDSSSSVLTTGLVACNEIEHNWWVQNTDQLTRYIPAPKVRNYTFLGKPYMCRNGSLAHALEDLAINTTLSMLGLGSPM
jgi:hypothetical protein